MPSREPVLCATILTRDYLPRAQVLFQSVRDHNQMPCLGLVIDAHEMGGDFVGTSFLIAAEVITPAQLQAMAFRYDAMELSCALRPYFLEALFKLRQAQLLLYMDSDMLVLSNLAPVLEEAAACPILLTYHTRVTTGLPPGIETSIFHYGTYNSGFLALFRGEEALALLRWWKAHLYNQGHAGFRQEFVDQKWLSLAPAFFPGIQAASTPGLNVAYWNLHEGEIQRDPQGNFTFAGNPLLLFHFSGWDPARPAIINKHWPNLTPRNGAWDQLSRLYLEKLLAAGLQPDAVPSYGYSHYPSGKKISLSSRRTYAEWLDQGLLDNSLSPFLLETKIEQRPPLLARASQLLNRLLLSLRRKQ